jgi:hypothetical protein
LGGGGGGPIVLEAAMFHAAAAETGMPLEAGLGDMTDRGPDLAEAGAPPAWGLAEVSAAGVVALAAAAVVGGAGRRR